MKTIDLSKGQHLLSEVLALAKSEAVVIHSASGGDFSFGGSFLAACREFVIPAEAGIQKARLDSPVSSTEQARQAPVCVRRRTGRRNDGWARLACNLKAAVDEERIEANRGMESLPFELGEHRRAAVKIVDVRGIESLKILDQP